MRSRAAARQPVPGLDGPAARSSLRQRLTGGDRRSIGQADAVAADLLRDPAPLTELVAALFDRDALIRMRAADVAEKVSRQRPEWLAPHRHALLERAASAEQQELRWHLALMLPRLRLSPGERERVAALLTGWLSDPSALVRTFCMQGLADLAAQDTDLRARVVPLLRRLSETGTPAMRSRGRHLLAALDGEHARRSQRRAGAREP